jgi:hypothetical protein
MQPDRHSVFTDSLQRFTQVNAMTIDFVATLLQRFGNIHGCYATVKCTLLAGFPFELELKRTDLLSLAFGAGSLFRFLLQQRSALGFNAFNVACGRLDCEIARQQIVARVTGPDSYNLAARSEVIHIFAQKYFRVCHLPSPNPLVGRVRKQRDIAGALDCFRQHALMRRTIAGDSSRQDLAPFGQVVLQQPHVFEIDQIDFVDTEATYTSPVHAAATAATTHWPSIAVIVRVVATAIAVFIVG